MGGVDEGRPHPSGNGAYTPLQLREDHLGQIPYPSEPVRYWSGQTQPPVSGNFSVGGILGYTGE